MLYGLHSSDPAKARKVIAGSAPIRVTLGDLTMFHPSSDYDVLVAEVDSPDLVALNAKLRALDHTDTRPEYIPHATVAYLKPGSSEWMGSWLGGGLSVEVGNLTFCPAEGPDEIVPLNAAPSEVHGDTEGHPFHGNQWTDGGGGGDAPGSADSPDGSKPRGVDLGLDKMDPVREADRIRMELLAAREDLNANPMAEARAKYQEVIAETKQRILEKIGEYGKIHGVSVEDKGFLGEHATTDSALAALDIHANLASQPDSVLDHFKEQGYSVRFDGGSRDFTVGDATFTEAAHVDYRGKEMVLRSGSFSSMNSSLREGVFQHEVGHIAVELLVGRVAQAMGTYYDPVLGTAPRAMRGPDGKPDPSLGRDPKAVAAGKYKDRMNNAWASFAIGTYDEGGVTTYSDSYVKAEKSGTLSGIDLFRDADANDQRDGSASITRANNENFAEWMGLLRSFTIGKPSGVSLQSFSRYARRTYKKPKQLAAFLKLYRELGVRRKPVKVAYGRMA